MLKATTTIDLSEQADLKNMPDQAIKETAEYFKSITPKRTGNARSKTRKRNEQIVAAYDYFESLEAGRSPQAPNGMNEPSLEYLNKAVERLVKRI